MSARKDGWFGRITRFRRRGRTQSGPQSSGKAKLSFESLEGRRLLAVSDIAPSVQGVVFADDNNSGDYTVGEELVGVTVQLFEDDGDGIFETNGDDVQFGTDLLTDANGEYCFDGIDGTANYFLVQPAQTVGGLAIPEQVSNLLSPGTPNLVIDNFATNQQAQAIPPAPASDSSTVAFVNESEVLGAERDLFVELLSGVGEVELVVNPFNLLPVLQFNSSSGVQGSAIVTWDGQDFGANPTPTMGLGGRDLTQGGLNTGIGMRIGIDSAGAGDTLTIRIYQGDPTNFSSVTAPIPVTGGNATGYLFIPFTDFSGPVSANNVDAIQMSIGDQGVPSADGQLDFIGAIGPTIVNLENSRELDLQVVKATTTSPVVPGEQITYQITVTNNGPIDVVGARIEDNFPAQVTNVTYTSTVSGTVTGNTASSTGDIDDTLNLAAGSSVTYVATGTVASNVTAPFTNTATVTAPNANIEIDISNNTDDVDATPQPEVDLQITKTDGVTQVRPGDTVTYTIVVTNAGPSDVVGARVTDTFSGLPLNNVTFTSTTTGTVTGNSATGSNNIDDVVNMAAGSTITYTVTGTVADTAETSLDNTANVAPPQGTVERNPNNNTADDSDVILQEVDLAVTKTNTSATVVPGSPTTYEIVVTNNGPRTATGAQIIDDNLASSPFQNVTFTSVATGGATGNSASGSAAINDTVTMPPGSTITYTVTGTISASTTGNIPNTVRVVAPQGVTDTNPNNNQDTETVTVVPTVDLSVTKTDGVTVVDPGDQVTYEIVVSNNGPSDVTGASLVDTLVSGTLTGITFTSSAQGGASGNSASGTGLPTQTLNLPAGSSVTYLVTGTVAATTATELLNRVQVSAPNGVTETNTQNNTAEDRNTIVPGVDLQIVKTNTTGSALAGGNLTYTIVVTNNGPNGVTGATIIDDDLQDLINSGVFTNVAYTSTSTGGATGNTSGSGNINDTVNMPASSSITYTVQAAIAPSATGTISNTAEVRVPTGVVETNTVNNISTLADPITVLPANVSGFVYVDLDQDGQRDATEPGIPGVEVQLEQNNTQVGSTTTGTDGSYQFNNLTPGTYDVVETQPTQFDDGQESIGGSIGSIVGNDRFRVTLAPGDNATLLNFGEISRQPSKRSLLASSFRN